jgi:hypothetical protein
MLGTIFRHPIILSAGIALVVVALYLSWRKHNLVLTGHLADGQVTELIPHRGSKGGVSYSLRVKYSLPDGQPGEFVTTFSSSPPLHDLHEKVRVVYYPGATSPDILAFNDLYLFPWVLFCTGLFLLLMCAGFTFGPTLINNIYLPALEHRL